MIALEKFYSFKNISHMLLVTHIHGRQIQWGGEKLPFFKIKVLQDFPSSV